MIAVTRRIQRVFVVAYNSPRTREEYPEGGQERIAVALSAVLAELQARIEGIRLTEEEATFIERMRETSVDQGFAGCVAVIMSRLGYEAPDLPDEGRHRT